MTFTVSAYAGETFRGVVDNTQATAEAAEAAALEWLADVGDKALSVVVTQEGRAVASYGWDEKNKAWAKAA